MRRKDYRDHRAGALLGVGRVNGLETRGERARGSAVVDEAKDAKRRTSGRAFSTASGAYFWIVSGTMDSPVAWDLYVWSSAGLVLWTYRVPRCMGRRAEEGKTSAAWSIGWSKSAMVEEMVDYGTDGVGEVSLQAFRGSVLDGTGDDRLGDGWI
jgi:hypothetical protein